MSSGKSLTLILIIFFSNVSSNEQNQSELFQCFVHGICFDSLILESIPHVATPNKCLQNCQQSKSGCEWFTHYNDTKLCFLFSSCIRFSPNQESCNDCISGQKECQDIQCGIQGLCLGAFQGIVNGAENQSVCYENCKKTKNCLWYSYNFKNKLCIQTTDCPILDKTQTNYYHYEISCSIDNSLSNKLNESTEKTINTSPMTSTIVSNSTNELTSQSMASTDSLEVNISTIEPVNILNDTTVAVDYSTDVTIDESESTDASEAIYSTNGAINQSNTTENEQTNLFQDSDVSTVAVNNSSSTDGFVDSSTDGTSITSKISTDVTIAETTDETQTISSTDGTINQSSISVNEQQSQASIGSTVDVNNSNDGFSDSSIDGTATTSQISTDVSIDISNNSIDESESTDETQTIGSTDGTINQSSISVNGQQSQASIGSTVDDNHSSITDRFTDSSMDGIATTSKISTDVTGNEPHTSINESESTDEPEAINSTDGAINQSNTTVNEQTNQSQASIGSTVDDNHSSITDRFTDSSIDGTATTSKISSDETEVVNSTSGSNSSSNDQSSQSNTTDDSLETNSSTSGSNDIPETSTDGLFNSSDDDNVKTSTISLDFTSTIVSVETVNNSINGSVNNLNNSTAITDALGLTSITEYEGSTTNAINTQIEESEFTALDNRKYLILCKDQSLIFDSESMSTCKTSIEKVSIHNSLLFRLNESIYFCPVTQKDPDSSAKMCRSPNEDKSIWEQSINLPIKPFHSEMYQLLDGSKWIIAGAYNRRKSIFLYENETYSNGPQLPVPMDELCSIQINKTHGFVSGFASSSHSFIVDLVNKTFQQVDSISENIYTYGRGCGWFRNDQGDQELVYFGGLQYQSNKVQKTTDIFSLKTMNWRKGPDYPYIDYNLEHSIQKNGYFYVVGGYKEIHPRYIYKFNGNWIKTNATLLDLKSCQGSSNLPISDDEFNCI